MHAEVRLAIAPLYGFLLTLARVGSAFAFVPFPGFSNTLEVARIVLVLGFTMALAPAWPAPPAAEPGIGQMAVWLAGEAAFGITVGLAVALAAESFVLASQIFGLQAGYSYASTIDPNSQADSSVLQVVSLLTASLLFFACGMDRHLIRIFADSLRTHPPGSYRASLASAEAIVKLGAGMLTTAMRLAMPVVALLVLVDLSLALVGRIHAHLQLLTLAFPAKMLTALAVLAAMSALFPVIYESAAERTVRALVALVGS